MNEIENMIGIIIVIALIFICLPIALYITFDYIRTTVKMKENQRLWDEYSRDMTYPERVKAYIPWVDRRRCTSRNQFYYFPSRFHTPPKFMEIYVNDVYYRGTPEEIAEKTHVSLEVIKQFERCIEPVKVSIDERFT